MFGHQLDFFLGDAPNLRDRPIRTLRELDPEHPHAAFVRGMAAFGLEEAGHYGAGAGRRPGRRRGQPRRRVGASTPSCTPTRCRAGSTTASASSARDGTHWEAGNLFTVHNWWHLALYQLEAGRPERALAIYDAEIHHAGSARRADRDARRQRAAVAAAARRRRHRRPLRRAGRRVGAEGRRRARGTRSTTCTRSMALRRRRPARRRPCVVSRPARALARTASAAANARDDRRDRPAGVPGRRWRSPRTATTTSSPSCCPIRRALHHFGGSHAQRDALQRTLLESALAVGRYELARALTAERLGVRETSVYGWTQRARALRGLGDDSRRGRRRAARRCVPKPLRRGLAG